MQFFKVIKKNHRLWPQFLLCLILSFFSVYGLSAEALTQSLSFKDLEVRETLDFPTVSAQHIIPFTIPKTWRVSGSKSYIELEFQHSSELQAKRSFIEVIVNERSLFKSKLTANNSKSTQVRIPLSRVKLKDLNTLKMRVVQHYTDKCEDPLDPSLWTQVLNSSRLVLNYTPVLPSVDLSAYPFPMIDALDYRPSDIRYILPKTAQLLELKALTLINLNLGQVAQQHSVHPQIHRNEKPIQNIKNQHLILIGTPKSTPEIAQFIQQFHRFQIRDQQWVKKDYDRKNKKALEKPVAQEAGLLFYFRHPKNPNKIVLIVSGNSPQGVFQAAKYLTYRPNNISLEGQEHLITQNWQPSKAESYSQPRYIENESRSFKDLGFGLREIEKINAPPLTYPISVVSNFGSKASPVNASMDLELLYSYSAGINPEFSSLEIRLNDRAIGNIPLTNIKGEERARATIAIPNELIQPQNNLVAQFHLLPDKYGFCVDNYVDKSWGKIHPASQLIVKGQPQSRLPDVAILNNTGFPYSRKANLETLHLILPKEPTSDLLESVLSLLIRLGRSTDSDTELDPSLSHDFSDIPEGRDVLAFVQNPIGSDFKALNFRLHWPQSNNTKQFQLANTQNVQITDAGQGLYMEQILLSKNSLAGFGKKDRILTRFTGINASAFQALRQLFEDDERFETLIESGIIKQLEPQDFSINTIPDEELNSPSPLGDSSNNFWNTIFQWISQHPFWASFAGLGLLVLSLLLFSLLLRRKSS